MTFQEESIGRSTIDQEVGEMQYYFRSNSSVVKYPHYSPADRENSLGPFLIFIIAPVLHSHSPLPYIPTTTSPSNIHPEGSTEEKSSGQKWLCWGQILLHFYLLPYELAATPPLSLTHPLHPPHPSVHGQSRIQPEAAEYVGQ